MAKKKTRSDILDSLQQQQTAEHDQHLAARRELIQAVHSGSLDDPQVIRTQVATLGVSIDELREEIGRLDARGELQKRLTGEASDEAKMQKLQKELESERQTFEAARTRWREVSPRLNAEIDQKRLALAAYDRIRERLRTLLADDEVTQVATLDDQLSELSRQRQDIMDRLGAVSANAVEKVDGAGRPDNRTLSERYVHPVGGTYVDSNGGKRDNLLTQLVTARSNVRRLEQQLATAKAQEKSKLQSQLAAAKASVATLCREVDDAEQELHRVEKEITQATATRQEHEEALLVG